MLWSIYTTVGRMCIRSSYTTRLFNQLKITLITNWLSNRNKRWRWGLSKWTGLICIPSLDQMMFVKICLYKPKTIKSWVAGLEEMTLIWFHSAFHTFSHGTANKKLGVLLRSTGEWKTAFNLWKIISDRFAPAVTGCARSLARVWEEKNVNPQHLHGDWLMRSMQPIAMQWNH